MGAYVFQGPRTTISMVFGSYDETDNDDMGCRELQPSLFNESGIPKYCAQHTLYLVGSYDTAYEVILVANRALPVCSSNPTSTVLYSRAKRFVIDKLN